MIETINYDKCNDCGRCELVCPMDVIRKIGKRCYIAFQQDCMVCFLCEIECSQEAIYVGPDRSGNPVMPLVTQK